MLQRRSRRTPQKRKMVRLRKRMMARKSPRPVSNCPQHCQQARVYSEASHPNPQRQDCSIFHLRSPRTTSRPHRFSEASKRRKLIAAPVYLEVSRAEACSRPRRMASSPNRCLAIPVAEAFSATMVNHHFFPIHQLVAVYSTPKTLYSAIQRITFSLRSRTKIKINLKRKMERTPMAA